MHRFPSLLVVLLVLVCTRDAFAYGDPAESYAELESEHFFVHYPVSREDFALRTIKIAEEAHGRLAPIFGAKSLEKTHITVENQIDDANGWARVVSRNEIHLYPYPPLLTEELGNYDDWMRLLFYHEYTHVLHMDTSDNAVYSVLNAIFGKFARGNATLPRWFTEGLAVYFETKTSFGGRLRSPLYRSMIRNAALANAIPSLGELSTTLVEWPAGSAQYLYGAFFIQWLARVYGEDKLIEFIHAYSRQIVPYAMNRVAVRVFGGTFESLWNRWRAEMKREARHELHAYERHTAQNRSKQLVTPHRHNYPRAHPTKEAFVYYKNDGYRTHELTLYEVASGSQTALAECWGTCDSRWSNDGHTLYFVHSESRDGYIRRSSLYSLDLDTQKIQQLTDDLHVRSFDVSETALYLTVQENESTALLAIPLSSLVLGQTLHADDFERLYQSEPFEQLDELNVFSSDAASGDKLALARFNTQFHRHEIAWNTSNELRSNHSWKRVPTTGMHIDASPEWSSDGESLSFVADDASGAFQRHLYHLESNELTMTTHRLDGIMHPTTLVSGDVIYVQYTARGMAIARIAKENLYVIKSEALDVEPNVIKEPNNINYKKRSYKPWRWLFPQTWSPTFSTNVNQFNIGLSFSGRDFFNHHNYNISANYNSRIDAVDVSLSYLYSPLLWNIGTNISFHHNTSTWFDGKRRKEYEYQTVSGGVSVSRVINGRTFSNSFVIAANVQHTQSSERFSWSLTDPAGDPPRIPSLGWQNGLTFSYTLSNLRQYEKVPHISEGQSLSTRLRFEAPWLGAQFYALTASLDFQAYWPMPWFDTHVLNLRLSAGTSYVEDSNREPFSLSTDTTFAFSIPALLNGSGDAAIHGYAPTTRNGQHYCYVHAGYEFGIYDPVLGSSTLPLGLQRMSAGIFGEWGYVWDTGTFNLRDSMPSVGAALHFDIALGYRLIQRITIGYAYGESHQFYFGLF